MHLLSCQSSPPLFLSCLPSSSFRILMLASKEVCDPQSELAPPLGFQTISPESLCPPPDLLQRLSTQLCPNYTPGSSKTERVSPSWMDDMSHAKCSTEVCHVRSNRRPFLGCTTAGRED